MNKTSATILIIVAILIVAGGVYFLFLRTAPPAAAPVVAPTETATTTADTSATTTAAATNPGTETIGTSAGGHPITADHYGTGSTEVLFVGGIHGGYESNTSLLAYQLEDYLAANPSAVPANETVTVIPELNPDGIATTIGTAGRFTADQVPATLADTIPGRVNADNVDIDRNFDCDWQTNATWQTHAESGGTAAFSEPESQAVEAYVNAHKPAAVVVFFSAAGGVYASSCDGPVSAATQALTSLYAKASGYPAYQTFDAYNTTGDMVNWLAKIGIPGISVLLTNHTSTDWSMNLPGIQAVLAQYAQ